MTDPITLGNFEAVHELTENDNFHTSIYEHDYDGLLIARCNQNGAHPHQVTAILNGLNGKQASAELVAQYASRISQQDAELERVRREVEEARADKARLDFLDECNKRLNTHHSTTYGWEMVMNHNVNRLMTGHLAVDLNDAKAHGFKSCRGAIDTEMKRIETARAARQNQGGEK